MFKVDNVDKRKYFIFSYHRSSERLVEFFDNKNYEKNGFTACFFSFLLFLCAMRVADKPVPCRNIL